MPIIHTHAHHPSRHQTSHHASRADVRPGLLLALAFLAACSSTGGMHRPTGGDGAAGTSSSAAGAGAAGSGVAGTAGGSGGATGNLAGTGGGAAGTGGGSAGAGGGSAGTGGATAGTGGATAGTGGASAGTGGASTGGSGGAPCAHAIFCDDFEAYTAGAAPKGPWKVTTNQGTVAVDTKHAHSGKNAVHALTMGTQSYESALMGLEGAPVFPVPNNGFFGRMLIYATQAPTAVAHWTIVQGEGPVPGKNITRAVYRYGGQYNTRFMANYDSGPAASDCWRHSKTTIPLNAWACVEWQFDGPTNTLHFWLDGQALDDLTVVGKGDGCIAHDTMDNWYAPTFNALRLGWEHYQQGPGELWIDDVVVDGKRIGCPAP
jgi:hypothetical protein